MNKTPKIEKDVEIPSSSHKRIYLPFDEMEVGDSVALDCSEDGSYNKNGIVGAMRRYRLLNEKKGVIVTFTTRFSKSKIFRVWLTQRAEVKKE